MEDIHVSKDEIFRVVSKIITEAFDNNEHLQLISVTSSGKTENAMKSMKKILLNEEDYRTATLALPYNSLLTEKYIKFTENMLKDHPEKRKFVALNKMFSFHKPLATIKFTTYDMLWYEITLNSGRRPLLYASNDDIIISDENHTLLQSDLNLFLNYILMLQYSNAQKIVMTATLPTGVQEFIDKNIIKPESGRTVRISTQRDRIKEVMKLILPNTENEESYIQVSKQLVNENKNDKILLIFNTISRTQAVYRELAMTYFPETNQDYLIHKFMEENNINTEELAKEKELQMKLIEYFRDKCEIILLTSMLPHFMRTVLETIASTKNKLKVIVSTQVVEIGFDDKEISLVATEIAPISSLIQRWGRIRNKGRVALLIPEHTSRTTCLPYKPAEYTPPYNFFLRTSEHDTPTIINNLLDYIDGAQKIIDLLSNKNYTDYKQFKQLLSKFRDSAWGENNQKSFRSDLLVFVLPKMGNIKNYRGYKNMIIQTSYKKLTGLIFRQKIEPVEFYVEYTETIKRWEKQHKFNNYNELKKVLKNNKNKWNIKAIVVYTTPKTYHSLYNTLL